MSSRRWHDDDHGHGPTGGHDPQFANNEVFDVIDLFTNAGDTMWRWSSAVLEPMTLALISGALTLLHITMLSLLIVMIRPTTTRKVCRAMGPLPGRICIVLATLSTVRTCAAAPRGYGRFTALGIPRQTDLELWASGQLTMREQELRALDEVIYHCPLGHGTGEARIPRYEVNVEEQEPGEPRVEVATVHVTLWVTAPYYEAEVIDAEVPFPTTVERLSKILKDTCVVIPEHFSLYAPATPQFGSFIAYPPWIQETDKVALIVDTTEVGGDIFGAYFDSPITREGILMNMVEGWPAGLQVYAFGSERPMRTGHAYEAFHGGVVKVLREGARPRWKDEMVARVGDPQRWNPEAPLPYPVDGLHTVYQSADDQVVEEIHSDDERTLEVSAEEALRIEHGDAWVQVPEERIPHLAHRGRRVWGQVAVFDGIDQYAREEPVIFLDLRGLALFPQWTQLQGTVFKPMEYYEELDMPDVPGWTLMVQGGEPRDDGAHIDIKMGDMLVMYLSKETGEQSEDATMQDSDDPPSDDDSDSSSNTSDYLNGSSSEGPPADYDPTGEPRGPPPPRPVNMPRSRSPRRRQTEMLGQTEERRELKIYDYLPVQQFDLTQVRLPFPHTHDQVRSLFKPWPATWRRWNLSGVDFNEAAKEVLNNAVSGDDILNKMCAEPPTISIYTDGSANEAAGRSGYAAVILLNLGAAVAVMGILGGQILGDPASMWPTTGNVAIAAALLWIIQARATIPWLECSIHYDCMAAGKAAQGLWAPVDELSKRIHNLEMILREMDGVDLTMTHVKSHVGHGWNEVADAIAKSTATGTHAFAQPPDEISRAMLTMNLDWVSTEMAAAKTGALHVDGGGLLWSECGLENYQLPANKLVPTLPREGQRAAAEEGTEDYTIAICSFNVQGIGKQYRYIEDQMDYHEYNLVLLQETKTGGGQCESARYHRLEAPADRHWGTAVWISKEHGLLKINGTAIVPPEADIRVLVSSPRLLAVVVTIGASKVGIVSAHCPHDNRREERGAFLKEAGKVLRELKKTHLLICGIDLNGRLPLNVEGVTGSLEFDDPDANGKLMAEIMEECGLDACTILTTSTTTRTIRVQKMQTVEGRAIVAEACRNFTQPPWNMHPDEHCQNFQEHMVKVMRQSFALPQRPQGASYIPDEVWALRQLKNQLKWRTRGRLRQAGYLQRQALTHWRHGCDPGIASRTAKHALLYDLVASAVKFATMTCRRIIAKAKDNYLRGLAATGPQSASAILRRAKQAGLGSKAKRPIHRELPKLLDPETQKEAETREDRDAIWLKYFGTQEAGSIVATESFLSEVSQSQDRTHEDWSWELLPSLVDIETVLRRTPKNKTAGLDQIPSDLVSACPSEFARAVQPLYLKSLLRGRQPIQWRGGILYEAFKGAGAQWDPGNHRSLYISSFVGKALHKTMRAKINDHLDNFLHPLHCGSRKGLPVLFPSLFIVQHLRWCFQSHRSAAVIFVDTKSAYYRLVRQIATGDLTVDRNVEALFHSFGLDGSDVAELREVILNGGMLNEAEVPGPIRTAAWDFHRESWFTTRFTTGEQVCRSTAGSRPGASWADCVFSVSYARILYRVHEQMEGESLNFSLEYSPESGPFTTHPVGNQQAAWDTTWADDSAYALTGDNPEEVIYRTSRLGSMIISAFRSHGLSPNLKRHKTSAILRLTGRGATKVRQRCFSSGRPGESLQIVPHYKHLGCVVDPCMKMAQEVRHRTALAADAYNQAKDLLLQNRDLALETRTMLFNTVVVSTYHNLEIWQATGKQWQQLSDNFSRLVRKLLSRDVPGEGLFKIPLVLAHWATGCWPLALYARRSRISALVSLALKGPDVLWAMVQQEGRWSQQLCDDLRWLVADDAGNWPEVQEASWPQWWHVLRQQPHRVKKRAQRQNVEDFRKFKEKAAIHVCLWHLHRSLPAPTAATKKEPTWWCRMCDKGFRTRAALSVHFFSVHNRCAEYRRYLCGTKCASCGTEYWTTGRLEDHLRASKKCVRSLRRRHKPQDVVHPGYGSRRRRKDAVENFTPAPPCPGEGDIREDGDNPWNYYQNRCHEELCNELLRHPLPDPLVQVLRGKLHKYPLYPEEISEVLDWVCSEVDIVNGDDDLQQWSREEYEEILRALTELRRYKEEDGAEDQRELRALSSFASFQSMLDSLDWRDVYKNFQGDNGTQFASLYSLPASWEAVWRQARDEVLSTAVVKDPGLLLPKPLRALWQEFLNGGRPKLQAPASFWGHPVAEPFKPFRDECTV
ncbi:unnamed protein product [Symbiodinium sp. CCMP2592]|nr:unnamed protein product [Symbiodinium sp. CCMP2592]